MPTHAEVTAFFQRFLPLSVNTREVPFLWHKPRHASYNPASRPCTAVILSITPTAGFYNATCDPRLRSAPVCFLHRPWNLDHRALRSSSLVLASHASLDEHLTVGWNVELAQSLELDLAEAVCIQGYKDNPDRKIGLVARLRHPKSLEAVAGTLKDEFHGAGELHFPPRSKPEGANSASPPTVSVIAIMNAFHAEEIARVLAAAREKGWIESRTDASAIVYLTGAARDYGLAAIKEVDMPAYCVGHRACEEWGIRFLARQLRAQWPDLEVVEVLEEEEPLPKRPQTGTKLEAETATLEEKIDS